MQVNETLSVGSPVFTADGRELGKVKEVSGDCFKVDARLQPDYWLGSDAVDWVKGGEVRLRFNREGITDKKMDGPDTGEHSGFHPHTL